jgi:hypothetical protein
MTVACAFFGLVPIMWSTGAGADVMKRIAAPMIGGLFTSFLMELLVYPAVYLLWRKRDLPREEDAAERRWWQRPAVVSGIAGVIVAIVIAGFMLRPGAAEAKPLYPSYNAARLALGAGDVTSVGKRAAELSTVAKDSGQSVVAEKASALAIAGDLAQAREAFAELSDAMIAYRNKAAEEPKPEVVYCPMVKHSWLQPKGEINNPYYSDDPGMKSCGEVKEP